MVNHLVPLVTLLIWCLLCMAQNTSEVLRGKDEKDESEDVTVEVVDEQVDERVGHYSVPPQLPIPDKFISSKDFLDVIGKGLEAAKVVANLVNMAYGTTNRRSGLPEGAEGPTRPEPNHPHNKTKRPEETNPFLSTLAGFFSLMGVDKSKFSTLAVNSLIVLVHLVINNLVRNAGEKDSERPEGNLYSWIFQSSSPQLKELLDQIQEAGVEERIIGLVRESSSIQTDCVQLLLCRLAPIIWGMQKALIEPPPADWADMSPVDRMYAYFPSFQQLIDHRPRCEIRFPNCRIKYRDFHQTLAEDEP